MTAVHAGGFFVFDPTAGGGGGAGTNIQSAAGAWTVPAGAAIGDLVYATGVFTAALADNGAVGTTPAFGSIIAKPTATTATVVYRGEAGGFAGLTPGALYFLGTAGGVVLAAGLPVAAGSVIQRVGVAANATTMILEPNSVSTVL